MSQNKKLDKSELKLEKVHNFLTDCVNKMRTKQDKLMKKHNFGNENNKFVLYPERNAFYLFNKDTKKVFFKAKFQIIGTYSEKSKTWRWAWSNRYVPYDLKQTCLKIKKFGEANKVDILSKPKIKDENLGHIFTALGMELSKSQGYYIVPGTKTYPEIYLIFTQVKKVNLDYTEVVKQMQADKRANHKLMRDKLKPPTVQKPNKTTPKPKSTTKLSKKTKTENTKNKKSTVKTKSKKSSDKKKTTLNKKPKPVVKKTKSPKKPVIKKSKSPKKKILKSPKNRKKSLTKSKKKISLVRNPGDKILIPLTKVAKLKTKEIKNNDYNDNENNNGLLGNNKVSNVSPIKTLSKLNSNTNSNSKSKATMLNNDNIQTEKVTKILVPVKKNNSEEK